MSTLGVWTFDTSHGAERGGGILLERPPAERASIYEAAEVSWLRGTSKPTTRLLPDLASDEALGEAFWGVLFGLVFYSPLLGAADGSATGGLSGSLAGFGIDDTFVNRLRDTVTPGTSALFVLGSDAVLDDVGDALRVGQSVTVLMTRIDRSQEGYLRQVFVG
jgi:uncharacterized membrane protein